MRQPVLIFDFGNVVAFFDYLKACERFGARLGLDGPAFRRLALERGFVDLLAEFECGRITPEDFSQTLMSRCGLSLPYDQFVRDWEDIFTLNESIARLIPPLKAEGYRLLLGSNTNVLHATHYRRQFATTLDLFDGLVLSHAVGSMKPDREFYLAGVRAAGVPAASCVFIDDIPENVEGAFAAGLTALLYEDTPKLIAGLRGLGVEVPAGEG
jgi:glucose-1-phosphatase